MKKPGRVPSNEPIGPTLPEPRGPRATERTGPRRTCLIIAGLLLLACLVVAIIPRIGPAILALTHRGAGTSRSSQQAHIETEDLASREISGAPVGTNLAYLKPVTVSRELVGFTARMAVDRDFRSWWSSGAFAPQWMRVDLGADFIIAEIRLLPSQSPTGRTVHRLLINGAATNNVFSLLHTFDGVTQDSKWISLKPAVPIRGVRSIRVETTSSPSWIGWREIEVIAGE